MRGTGSNDISVSHVFVPKSRTFAFVPDFEPGSHYRGPLYRLPVVGAAASGIPTPMLGVARRALDEVTELARTNTPVAASGLLKEALRLRSSWAEGKRSCARGARCYSTP
jgi:indole-3-acetate monooxygenase